MDIVPFGFRELCIVNDADWTLPIYADPYSSDASSVTHWHIKPAKQLLSAPFEELRKRFGPYNLANTTASWYVEDADLKRIATKPSGCDPAQYMRWEKADVKSVEAIGIEEIKGPSKPEEKFLNFMFKRAAIDPRIGRYYWGAMKEAMLHWLINVQRPIDFEIFEIHPTPYRANWKDIMLAKHQACARIFQLPQEKWTDAMVESGFMEDLGSTDLMAMDSNFKFFNWTLEIEPKNKWLNAMEEAERSRIESKKPGNYLRYYEGCIRNRLDDTIKVFAAWIKAIRKPVGRISQSPVSGVPILQSVRKNRNVLPAWHRPDKVSFQPFDGVRVKSGQGNPRALEAKAKEMLAVPGFQSHHENLRRLQEPRPLEESGNGGDGGDGVRVSHANEGEAEVIEVLATNGATGPEPGVDGK
jgi:hypothetical protein